MSMPTGRMQFLAAFILIALPQAIAAVKSHGAEPALTIGQPDSVTGWTEGATDFDRDEITRAAMLQPGDAEAAEGDDDAQSEDAAISDEG